MKNTKLTALLIIQIITSLIFQDNIYSQSQNNALHFDGVDDYVEMASPIQGNGDFTFEAWFKLESNSVPGFKRIVALNGEGSRFEIGTDHEKIAYFVHPDDDPSGVAGHIVTDFFVGDGLCHHIAAVKSGSDFILYLDGIEIVFDEGHFGNDFTTGFSMTLGRWGTSAGEYWKGQIDEVRVWDRERVPREIYEYKDKKLLGMGFGLVLNLQFDEGIANGNNEGIIKAHDISPSKIEATLHNFSLNGTASNWVNSCVSSVIYFGGLSHQLRGNVDYNMNEDNQELRITSVSDNDNPSFDIKLGQVKGFSYTSSPPEDDEDDIESYQEMKLYGSIDGIANTLIRTSRDEIVMYNEKIHTKWTTDFVDSDNTRLYITNPSGETLVDMNIPNNEPLYFRHIGNGGGKKWPSTSTELSESRSNDDNIVFIHGIL